MEIENRKSTFIRDLIVKVLLIVLFIFLLMFLFPMPNLTTFYDAIFNNNVQTMKNAAEKWYTTDRMPKEDGDIEKLTLQEMLDKKLILPFVDKDGNTCDADSSYVSVTKDGEEYILKVSLTCGSQTDYIIEHIGCYNFCKDNSCVQQVEVATDDKGEVKIKVPQTIVPTNNKYAMEYEYRRTHGSEKWTLGDWRNSKLEENSNTKLVDTRTQYTGQKKVTSGTTLYKHVKYEYKDKWSYDTNWTEEVKQTNENLKLYAERTLYTGKKKTVETVNKYKHIKYGIKDNWTVIDWSNQQRTTNSTTVLTETRYLVRKTVKTDTTKGKWSGWKKDSTWRSSRPSNTSNKQWGNSYNSKTVVNSTSTNWVLVDSSYESRSPLGAYSSDGNYKYVFNNSAYVSCTSTCNGQSEVKVYYYTRYKKQVIENKSTLYQYLYRTYSESTSSSTKTDEKYVDNATPYVKDGYTVIRTEYKYKVNHPEQIIEDVTWTESVTPPAGYTYTGQSTTVTVTRYTSIGKWVTNRKKLGEYTNNIVTRKQYKYRYNSPERYISDTIWTTSITPPAGYTYTGESKTNTKTSYADLGKWVNSKSELGEYTYNIEKRTQYRYKTRTTSSYTETKWFSKDPGGDWVATGNSRRILVK